MKHHQILSKKNILTLFLNPTQELQLTTSSKFKQNDLLNAKTRITSKRVKSVRMSPQSTDYKVLMQSNFPLPEIKSNGNLKLRNNNSTKMK